MKRIKAFLERWNLLPILWPVEEDGFLNFLKDIIAAPIKGIANYKSGQAQKGALEDQIRLDNETRQRLQDMFGGYLNTMGGADALLGAIPTTTSTGGGGSTSSTSSRFNQDTKFLDKAGMLEENARRKDAARRAPDEARGEVYRQLERANRAERGAIGAAPAGTTGPAGRSNAIAQIRSAMTPEKLDIMSQLERNMRENQQTAGDRLLQSAGLATGQKGVTNSNTVSNYNNSNVSTTDNPIGRLASLFGVTQGAYGDPLQSTQTGLSPGWDALGDAAGAFGTWQAGRRKPGQGSALPGGPIYDRFGNPVGG